MRNKKTKAREIVHRLLGEDAPRSDLRKPSQVEAWLKEWGNLMPEPGGMILIGSAGLLWNVLHVLGKDSELPSNSMDADVLTDSDLVAEFGYTALIGSQFERKHGFHVNLMPNEVLTEMNSDWRQRANSHTYGNLTVTVPAASDLFVPKLKAGRPRDLQQHHWAKEIGLVP